MPRGKPEQAEQIIPKLREVEVELGRGKTVAEAVKKIGVTEQDLLPLEEEVRRSADRPGEAAKGARERELSAEALAGGCRAG
jgi:hypothetical protein